MIREKKNISGLDLLTAVAVGLDPGVAAVAVDYSVFFRSKKKEEGRKREEKEAEKWKTKHVSLSCCLGLYLSSKITLYTPLFY